MYLVSILVPVYGVEKYIDTPVKRYSSGMTVRLGFSIAAHLEPEILVVDEVLAVGDAEFQKKAIGKMQDVSRGGERTVLFVSHNMAAIRNLCHNGVVLNNGKLDFIGQVDECIDHYMQLCNKGESYTSLADAKREGKWGCLDHTGRFVVPYIFNTSADAYEQGRKWAGKTKF